MWLAVHGKHVSTAVVQVIGTLTEAAAADLGLPTTVVVAPGLCLH
jgi:ribulose kinase